MTAISAIETEYAGCRFRSRLEARWAVFFDQAGIEWQYESQGFVGHFDTPYLPDFYLPKVTHGGTGVYVEVKGTDEQLHRDSRKLGEAIDYHATPISNGLLILGEVPDVHEDDYLVCHSLAYWRKGVAHKIVSFTWDKEMERYWLVSPRMAPTYLYEDDDTESLPGMCSTSPWIFQRPNWRHNGDSYQGSTYANTYTLYLAYRAARSARFEHGETPKRP